MEVTKQSWCDTDQDNDRRDDFELHFIDMNDPSKITKKISNAFGLISMKGDNLWYYNRNSLFNAKWDDL